MLSILSLSFFYAQMTNLITNTQTGPQDPQMFNKMHSIRTKTRTKNGLSAPYYCFPYK